MNNKKYELYINILMHLGNNINEVKENALNLLYMYDEDMIDYLITLLKESKNNNKISDNEYNNFIKLIAESLHISENELLKRTKWLEELNLDDKSIRIKESNIVLMEVFDELNKLLNDYNIDYHHTSGFLSYLLVDKELERYHHDMDIFIDEKEFEKLEEIIDQTHFIITTKLTKRNDGTLRRNVKMYHKDHKNIPISIFLYTKEKDESITVNDYYFKNDILFLSKTHNDPVSSRLSFSDRLYYHNGIPYKAITLEALYDCKSSNRKKDLYDKKIMEPYVDYDLLNQLSENMEVYEEIEEATDQKVIKKLTRLYQEK